MKGCILRLFCLVVFLLAIMPVHAEEEALKNRVALSGLLTSSDSWQIEFSYHYMFNKYIGLGGSVGLWKVYYEEGWASGSN